MKRILSLFFAASATLIALTTANAQKTSNFRLSESAVRITTSPATRSGAKRKQADRWAFPGNAHVNPEWRVKVLGSKNTIKQTIQGNTH